LQVHFSAFTTTHFLALLLLVLLAFISAMVSASETAYFSLTPQDIDKLKHQDTKNSRRILAHLSKPSELLGTILLFNNMVNIAIVLLSAYIMNSLIDFSNEPVLGFLIQTAAVTFLLVLFSEITPKTLATQHPLHIANTMAIPLHILNKLAIPFNYLTVNLGDRIFKNVGNRGSVSIDDLSQAVDITTAESAEDKKILKGIVRFVNIDVKSIMLPRVKMAAVEVNTNFTNLRNIVTEHGYSRVPVYEKTLDNIKGFLSVKDLLPYLNIEDDNFDWQKLIRQSYFIPENKKINDLLEEFRRKKIHLAIVVDEFGGTEGLVTLEDILEEIVGEISDETD
jgi:gliding motility-associated protein GldE